MRLPRLLAVGGTVLGLAACVSTAPLRLPDDHPASTKAAEGPIDVPSALADYKGADQFAAPVVANGGPRGGSSGMAGMPHGGMGHAAMEGMSHGSMPGMNHDDMPGMSGMRHQEAPQGDAGQ
jgi:hypothetical protein